MAGGKYYARKTPKKEPAKQVATKTYVKRAISASKENKFEHQPTTARYTSLSTTLQTPWLINTIPQGDTAEQRDGSKVKLTYLKLDLNLVSTTTHVPSTFRFVLLHVKNPRGVVPLTDGSDVFDQANPTIISQYNPDISFSTRFKVLKDWTYTAENPFSSVTPHFYYTRCYIPLNIIQESFADQTTGLITGIDKGALYLYCIAESSSGAFTLNTAHHLTYKDY